MHITRTLAASTMAVLALSVAACSEPAAPAPPLAGVVEFTCGAHEPMRVERTEVPDFTETWDTHERCIVTDWIDGDRTRVENDAMTVLGANVLGQEVPDREALTPVYERCATSSRVPGTVVPEDYSTKERIELSKQLTAMLALCSDHPHEVTYLQQADVLGDMSTSEYGGGEAAIETTTGAGQITDEVGVLRGRELEVVAAVNEVELYSENVLFVAFVDSFSGASGSEWANAQANNMGLGANDLLLAVAIDDGLYGLSVDSSSPLSDRALNEVESAAEARLRAGDWPGAVIETAQELATAQ